MCFFSMFINPFIKEMFFIDINNFWDNGILNKTSNLVVDVLPAGNITQNSIGDSIVENRKFSN